MEQRRRIILVGGAVTALVVAGIAIAQVAQVPRSGPVETNLAPSRADSAALAQARQSPLVARLDTVLGNNPGAAGLLGQIRASSVPVLGPPDPGLLLTARFYPGDRQYTLVVRPAGQIVEILGSTLAFQAPEGVTLPPPAPPPGPTTVPATVPRTAPRTAPTTALTASPTTGPTTGRTPTAPPLQRAIRQSPLAAALAEGQSRGLRDIRTERTEYGVDVSFSRFGAVYNVSFICDDRASLECSDAAAVQFAARLELIGGGQ